MRLRNPGGIEAALSTVQQVRGELWNASIANGAAARKDGFLSWCNGWGTPHLGNHFPPTEDLFAELGASHNRVALAPQMSVSHLNGLISRECSEWLARLDRVTEELQGRMTFLRRPGHLVVLDTSAAVWVIWVSLNSWNQARQH
jgi:hypothetical protein